MQLISIIYGKVVDYFTILWISIFHGKNMHAYFLPSRRSSEAAAKEVKSSIAYKYINYATLPNSLLHILLHCFPLKTSFRYFVLFFKKLM